MKHRYFIVYILSIIMLSNCSKPARENFEATYQPPVKERYYKAQHYPDRIMQSIARDPARQISISWRTTGSIFNGYVEYLQLNSNRIDATENAFRKSATVTQVRYNGIHDHYFKVVIDSLIPETEYLVRVGNDVYRSEWFPVRTAPDTFKPFHFLYFGDVQDNIRELAPRLFRNAAVRFPNARFLVHAGDLVSNNDEDDTWGEWFYSGGWLFQQTPSLAVAGNSEHLQIQTQPGDQRLLFPQWNGIFNFPSNGPQGLENLAYYFDYPGIRVVALYSTFGSIDGGNKEIYLRPDVLVNDSLFDEQLRWLRRVLASNIQPWLAVVIHHPVFTARKGRDNETLQQYFRPLFEEFNVDLVLQGHDHVYARGSNPDRSTRPFPVYVISVAGGKMHEVDKTHFWLKRSLENMQLYQAIHVSNNNLRFETIDIRGRIVDRFTITRNASGDKRLLD